MKKIKNYIEPFLLNDEQKEIAKDGIGLIAIVFICTIGLFGGMILLNSILG